MPVDKDLKAAYSILYDEHDPLKALRLYETILKEYPGNLTATIYKAASLEKLYYGATDWHNDQTLENSKESLKQALIFAQNRGDRLKIGLVYFRYFVHFFNAKEYETAQTYMEKCEEYGYKDDTLPMWDLQLQKKLKKSLKKDENIKVPVNDPAANVDFTPAQVDSNSSRPSTSEESHKFRTDWYQTASTIVLSLFTSKLPKSKESVHIELSPENKKSLRVSYDILETGAEFQYSLKLAHEVDTEGVKVSVFTKKIELTLKKLENIQWKTLEYHSSSDPPVNYSQATKPSAPEVKKSLEYPSSSKKQINWSKIDLGDEADNDEDAASADAFFQKLYADSDPDTKRAMMKSFVESNGTALNTNWEDVSKKKVDTSPPEGMELKDW